MAQTRNDEQEILKAVSVRAAVDKDFRALTLSNPQKAIETVVGRALPRAISLKFVERDPSVDAMYVLPDFVASDHKLTPEELEAVAGGCEWTCIFTSIDIDIL